MFEMVKAFRDALGIEATWSFVLIVAAIGALVTGSVAWIVDGAYKNALAREKPASDPTPTALFAETQMIGLPIHVDPQSLAHVVSLNKRRLKSKGAVNWGFYEVANNGAASMAWPSQKVMDAATKADNPGVFAWRVKVSNHGGTILRATIPIKLWFGAGKSPEEIVYNAIIAPLAANSEFVFYLVNDCPVVVNGAWPDTATVHVAGESSQRSVPLNRTFRSPIDQIVMFFPSTTRLVGDHPCEGEDPKEKSD
jgi:hypothetical protein